MFDTWPRCCSHSFGGRAADAGLSLSRLCGQHHKAKGPKLEPVGTTFAFPDAKGSIVDVTLLQVQSSAPPKTKYKGLHGKGPVVGLEFNMKNISATPASLTLFSTILYYSSTVVSFTGNLGATSLGSSLNLKGTLAPGKQRSGWITIQGSTKSMERIQATLNGTNTGSWKP